MSAIFHHLSSHNAGIRITHSGNVLLQSKNVRCISNVCGHASRPSIALSRSVPCGEGKHSLCTAELGLVNMNFI